MSEKLLLEITVILLGCLLGGFGWAFRRHDAQHEEMKHEIASVKHQRVECGAAFATKGSMERAHTRIDEADAQLHDLSNRVTRLESREGLRPGGCHEA